MKNYYFQLADCPAPGMIYLDNGQYLFKKYIYGFYTDLGAKVLNFSQSYLLKDQWRKTILADTDGGCDRLCNITEYVELKPENVIVKDGEPIGFYLDFGYSYIVSKEKPNVHIFYVSDTEPFHHTSDHIYTLIEKEDGEIYESFSRVY